MPRNQLLVLDDTASVAEPKPQQAGGTPTSGPIVEACRRSSTPPDVLRPAGGGRLDDARDRPRRYFAAWSPCARLAEHPRRCLPEARIAAPPSSAPTSPGSALNSVAPARAGDVLKLVLTKRRSKARRYATLTPTLIVETLFDTVVAAGVLIWALQQNVLPGLDRPPEPPCDRLALAAQHPRLRSRSGSSGCRDRAPRRDLAKRVPAFKQRVAAGFAILRDPQRFVTGVISWQALSWVFRAATCTHSSGRSTCRRPPTPSPSSWRCRACRRCSRSRRADRDAAGTDRLCVPARTVAKTRLVSFSVGMQIALTVVQRAPRHHRARPDGADASLEAARLARPRGSREPRG